MPATPAASAPWQEVEEQAYHAWREWPIWLVLRARELAPHSAAGRPQRTASGAAPAAETAQSPSTTPEEGR